MNEPWLGDALNDWSLFLPGRGDKNIFKMHKSVHDAIRKVDDTTIIMYEPATGGNLLGALPVGFSEGPGGEDYNDRQALSYHIYCPLLESDIPIDPHGGSGFWDWLKSKLLLGVCNVLNTVQYDIRYSDAKKLKTAGFMTEFGTEIDDLYCIMND